MTYRTIVVGTDGSATARLAERTAATLARAFDARLLVASAYGDSAERTDAILRRSVEEARIVWPNVESRAAAGSPAETLVALAEAESADLLVVGNKGMTGRARLLLGSVPDRVSHMAPCDLLIVRTTDGPAARPPLYRRLLLATDGSQTSLAAVRRGFDFSAAVGATPVLFYAGHPNTGEIVFEEVTREFLPAGMLQRTSARGDPANAITETARKGDYDLVVIGNKGMLGRGPHIGSVPNKVSHQATTDLLIVKTVTASVAELLAGQGALVTIDGRKAAVFVDELGVVHRLSARCTHMGCTVEWNADDRTWDCPCHGSRYDARGRVMRGPAKRPMAPLGEVETDHLTADDTITSEEGE